MTCTMSAGGAPEAGAGRHDPGPGRGEGEGGAARHQAHRPGHTDEEQVGGKGKSVVKLFKTTANGYSTQHFIQMF